MNVGRTVFSQLTDFLPMHQFRRCVARYRGNRKVQRFSCLDQFLCMAFAQLTYRESLRDIEACLRAMQPKLYHMGLRGHYCLAILPYHPQLSRSCTVKKAWSPPSWTRLPLIATVARLLCRELTLQNEYLRAENRVLKAKVKGRIRFTDEERHALVDAALAMGRKLMRQVVGIVKPETILA